ncbi:MAG: dynamin family protein [Thermodesulfobacteriota bacterium]
MEDFESCKNDLMLLGSELSELFSAAGGFSGPKAGPFSAWADNTTVLTRQMAEGLLRIAVVGAIKSGKSTFVNAFFGGDFVKRGAGVVTSIVTRIATGKDLSARVTLKSWHEVNEELAQTLVLFPSPPLSDDGAPLDIRKDSDRERIRQALSSLDRDRLVNREGRDPNFTLLSCFVAGFEKMKGLVTTGAQTLILAGDDFGRHRDFVGDENLAVYLKDVLLTLPPLDDFPKQVEIADCQGADSPNPLHLAMIEDYLVRTHLIVYVIGSRMGLRRADVRFLTLIRDMGLWENMVFVVNVDISEHESLERLESLLARIREEIALVVPAPRVLAFSALLDLFSKSREPLAHRDQDRLAQWRAQEEIASFCGRESGDFFSWLTRRLTADRMKLLLQSPAERMRIMTAGVLDWARVRRAMLRTDSDKATEAFSRIEKERRNMEKVRLLIRDTLEGALLSGKRELGREVDRFFDQSRGELLTNTRTFLTKLAVSPAAPGPGDPSVSTAVYAAYTEIRSAADRYLTDTVNPAIVNFVLARERDIQELFLKIETPFATMAQEAVDRYNQALASLSAAAGFSGPARPSSVSVSAIKQARNLSLPPLSANIPRNPLVQTEALAHEGALRLFSSVKKLLGIRPDPVTAKEKALERAISRIKEQSWETISENFTDFRENLKHQYLYKLMDMGAREILGNLDDRFRAFLEGTSAGETQTAGRENAGADLEAGLAQLEARAAALTERISSLCAACAGAESFSG